MLPKISPPPLFRLDFAGKYFIRRCQHDFAVKSLFWRVAFDFSGFFVCLTLSALTLSGGFSSGAVGLDAAGRSFTGLNQLSPFQITVCESYCYWPQGWGVGVCGWGSRWGGGREVGWGCYWVWTRVSVMRAVTRSFRLQSCALMTFCARKTSH